MFRWYSLFLALAITFHDCLAQIVVSPVNQAAVVGSAVTLNCQVPDIGSPFMQWTQFIDATANVRSIVSLGEVIPNPHFANFTIILETSGGNVFYNLQMNPLRMDYGARYECLNLEDSSGAQAYVIVLESDPVCSANASLSDLMAGETVRLTCSVRYSVMGNQQELEAFSPVMAWSGPGVPPAEDESVTGYVSQFSIVIPLDAETNGDTFSCITSFNTPPNLPPLSATNAPAYRYSWTSDSFNVQYAPIHINANPRGPGLTPGTDITCTASGNPYPTFEWVNLGDNTTTIGNKFTVPGYNDGGSNEFRIICRASNQIRGQTYIGETHPIIFDVLTTTSTTTIATSTAVTTVTTEQQSTIQPGSSLGTGAIVGICAGAAAVVLIMIVSVLIYLRKYTSEKASSSENDVTGNDCTHNAKQNVPNYVNYSTEEPYQELQVSSNIVSEGLYQELQVPA